MASLLLPALPNMADSLAPIRVFKLKENCFEAPKSYGFDGPGVYRPYIGRYR